MRKVAFAAAFAALTFAGAAAADPVTNVTFSPELQTELEETYGVREGEFLQDSIRRSIENALQRSGADLSRAATIDVTVIDADPSRPTFKELGDTPGLDYFHSIRVGGAELTAVIRDANGTVLSEVEHRRYAHTLNEVSFSHSTWGDARRAIRTFAEKVADAYPS